jgi:hypothetical protein
MPSLCKHPCAIKLWVICVMRNVVLVNLYENGNKGKRIDGSIALLIFNLGSG